MDPISLKFNLGNQNFSIDLKKDQNPNLQFGILSKPTSMFKQLGYKFEFPRDRTVTVDKVS